MNESELESELRKLRPAAPSRGLEEGIARDLAACSRTEELPPRTRAVALVGAEEPRASWFTLWLDRLLWSGLGAAATVVVLVLLQKPHDAPPQVVSRDVPVLDASALQPVLASEEDLGWRDEGVQFDPHGRPMLKLTRTAVERQAWADLKNAGVVEVEKPRQEIMWVPVNMQ